ncbi:aminopeptidase, partial [Gemmatimonadota bacterium]
VLIFYCEGKDDIAQKIGEEFEKKEVECHLLRVGKKLNSGSKHFRALLEELSGSWGLVFLLHPVHAPFLFETVGRPDYGIKLSSEHFFCDWLIRPGSLIRTYGLDLDELHLFRQKLLSQLKNAKKIRISTNSGTDITLSPRYWNINDGEVFTAPVENSTNGIILVDGCAYGGPPREPFSLKIRNGEVVNLTELNENDKQQNYVLKDLNRDENARVLAELGIGINPGASQDADIIESEQARGTCHFGFGHNIGFGGQNNSSSHIDYVILDLSIEIDGKLICRAGDYLF